MDLITNHTNLRKKRSSRAVDYKDTFLAQELPEPQAPGMREIKLH